MDGDATGQGPLRSKWLLKIARRSQFSHHPPFLVAGVFIKSEASTSLFVGKFGIAFQQALAMARSFS